MAIHTTNREDRMTRRIVSFCTGMALGWGTEIAGAAESILDIEAKPTIAERVSHDIVKGTLVNIDGESYWVRDTMEEQLPCMSMCARNGTTSSSATR
jgi:hypothetical protein